MVLRATRNRSLLENEFVATSQTETIADAVVFDDDFSLPLKKFFRIDHDCTRSQSCRFLDWRSWSFTHGFSPKFCLGPLNSLRLISI